MRFFGSAELLIVRLRTFGGGGQPASWDLKREAVAEAGPDRSPALAAAGRGSDDQVERFKLVQARAPMMTATGPAMA